MINLSDQYNHTTTSSSFSLHFSPSKKTIPLKNYLSNSFSSLFRHDWTLYDLQYLFLLILGIFLFYIVETPGIMIKSLLVLLLFIGLCYSTMTRSFLRPFLPVVIWLILFYSCRFIPATKRPHIYVSVLPALENIIYGDNVSVIIAKNTNIAKDLLAWIPYGILHFSLPFLTSLGIWLVGIKGIGIKGVLPVFSRAFGYMNIAGVLTQLIFPCSPPWYEYAYGIDTPASYSIPGEAGGLKRIDKLFNSTTYEKAFSGSPMVFGAFPSLHSACAILQILFISYTLQQHKYNNQIYFIGFLYVIWIWWACMYFTHHYMVDLVGGGVYAIASFWFSWKWLPRIVVIEDENDQNDVQSDVINITIGNDNDVMENIRSNNKFNNKRWEYEEVQKSLGNDDSKFIITNNINDNNNVHNNIDDNDAFIIDNYNSNSNSRSRSISRSSSRDSSRGSSRSSSRSSSSKSSVGSNSRTNYR